MKKLIIFLISISLLVFLSIPSMAGFNPFEKYDARDYALLSFRVVDWNQTLQGQNLFVGGVPYGKEANPILGEHPSGGEINNYFFALLVIDHYMISTKRSNPVLYNIWWSINSIAEIKCIDNNYGIGLKFKL